MGSLEAAPSPVDPSSVGKSSADSSWVDAAPFRAHLEQLVAVTRLPVDAVAQFVGISPLAARSLLSGRGGRPVRKISPDVARRLLRVTVEDARGVASRWVPAAGTRERLTDLAARGVALTDVAARYHISLHALEAVTGGAERCGLRLALQVKSAHGGLGFRARLGSRLPGEGVAA